VLGFPRLNHGGIMTLAEGCVELPKFQNEKNGFFRSLKIDSAQKLSWTQLRSEGRFVPSIFHAAAFLPSQDRQGHAKP
jgi:hypothetical protein